MNRFLWAAAILAGFAALGLQQVSPQKAKIYNDLGDTFAGPWIYDDMAAGLATAKKSSKPMLVVFR